jgi:hypothetical protein
VPEAAVQDRQDQPSPPGPEPAAPEVAAQDRQDQPSVPGPEPAAPEVTPQDQPPAPGPEPATAETTPQDQPVPDAQPTPAAASPRSRKPSARSVRREAARGKLQEIITRVDGEIEEAKGTEARTRKTVMELKDRIRTLTAERDAAEGDARAALDKEIEQLNDQLTKDDGGGYQDQLTGATRRVYDLKQYVKKVKAALTLNRPGLRAATKRAIEVLCNWQQLLDGRWIDANTKKVITDKVVFGHKPDFEHWRLAIQAVEQGMTQAQFNDWVNAHPEWFQIESKAENESHAHENHAD